MTTELRDGLALALGVAPERIAGLKRLSGGASQQTWAFELAGDAGGAAPQPLILRRAVPASERGSHSAGLDAEADLIALAGRRGIPVPALVARLTPAHGIGQGFVMQRLPGQALGRRIVAAPELAQARAGLARRCGEVLATIHALPLADLPALRRAGPAAELEHLRAWHARHGTARPVFQLALQWLQAHRPPEPAALSLVHGDFRNGNLLVDAAGLTGVLDWELAHVGDPASDLGWLCVNSWRFGVREQVVGGFGSLQQLAAGYGAGGGVFDAQRVHWWQVAGTLRWGVICESMLHAWLTGAEGDNIERAAIGRRASETEIDLLELIAPRQPEPAHA